MHTLSLFMDLQMYGNRKKNLNYQQKTMEKQERRSVRTVLKNQ